MINKTNPEFLKRLSIIASQKLELIPIWVQTNLADSNIQDYKVLEGGQVALVVQLGQNYVLKIFIPKFKDTKTYELKNQIIQNYSLLEQSNMELTSLGIFDFRDSDSIMKEPVLLLENYPNTKPLVEVFYTLSNIEKQLAISDLVKELKKFNQPVSNQKYSTQRILDLFDKSLEENTHKVDQTITKKFLEIRNSVQPKIISKNLFLVHNDIHLENVLVDEFGKIEIIDFDFCHFAPRFVELGTIFLFCFMPLSVVPESLEEFYQDTMEEVFDQFVLEYPELSDSEFNKEIKLLFATELLPKLGHPKFQHRALKAYTKFFLT